MGKSNKLPVTGRLTPENRPDFKGQTRTGRKKAELTSVSRQGSAVFFLIFLLVLDCLFVPGSADADGMGGYLELNYNNTRTYTDDDETGVNSLSKTGSFGQLYNLTLSRSFYPNLFLNAGGTFENTAVRSSSDDNASVMTTTSWRPFADLTLKSQVFTAGGKYNIREVRTTGSDTDQLIRLNENYSAVFGWKPAELPSVDVRFDTTNLYDKDRIIQDTKQDLLSLALRYMPEYNLLKGLDVRYQPTYTKIDNMLDGVVTTSLAHNGRVTYSDSYYKRRITVYTSYNISHSETKITTSSSTSEILTQLFPFSGLSAVDDTPAEGVLAENSDLIDGNLTVSAGINIGVGDTKPRNIGLDFSTASDVNIIYVWVNRELPAQIVNSFSWDIYTSQDNQNWTLYSTVPAASFGAFQNRFEISFSNVKTRYIKVVTTPLTAAEAALAPGFTDPGSILVTEIQALLRTPSSEFGRKLEDTATNHIYNLDIRTKIMDVPVLFYEFSYFLTKVASSFTNTTLSNGFSVNHGFGGNITTQARVAREDTVLQEDNGVSYLYNASLTARPLQTLSHTINYSGELQETGDERSNSNSLFISNSAELYKGVNVNLTGGVSFQRANSGQSTRDMSFSLGSGIVPHRRLTIDMYYSNADTRQTGGDQDISEKTERETLGLSYKPFDTIYLLFSFERVRTESETKDLYNYGANWSPFPDGSLQFTFSSNQNINSDGDIVTLISPNVRWKISRRTFLDLSGQFLKNESDAQTSESTIFSTTFRTAL
ncbi:MAG: hypothetical protein AB1499_01075 [Nitrospirota bacterium]